MEPSHRPVLLFYGRAACEPCIEARRTLQWALEERALRGEVVPIVQVIDVDTDPALLERYGALVPVVAVDGSELPLVTSARQLRRFLSVVLPAVA
jgi:hypothetical protein